MLTVLFWFISRWVENRDRFLGGTWSVETYTDDTTFNDWLHVGATKWLSKMFTSKKFWNPPLRAHRCRRPLSTPSTPSPSSKSPNAFVPRSSLCFRWVLFSECCASHGSCFHDDIFHYSYFYEFVAWLELTKTRSSFHWSRHPWRTFFPSRLFPVLTSILHSVIGKKTLNQMPTRWGSGKRWCACFYDDEKKIHSVNPMTLCMIRKHYITVFFPSLK